MRRVGSARPGDRGEQRRHAEHERDEQDEARAAGPPSGPSWANRRSSDGAPIGTAERATSLLLAGRSWLGVNVGGQRGLGRGAGDAVPAVEDEGRVPGAAVGRADRVRAIGGGEEQRHRQPRQRDRDEHGGARPPRGRSRRSRQTSSAEQGQRRQRDEPLEQLDVERETHRRRPRGSTSAPRPVCAKRTSSHSATTLSSIATASIVSLRAVSSAIGSTASASAPARPAAAPSTRRTAS